MPELVSGLQGELSPYIVYTVEPSSWPKALFAKRFLGCAFPVRPDGVLATCAHVVQSVKEGDELLVVQHLAEKGLTHKVMGFTFHQTCDVALLSIRAATPRWPTPVLPVQPLASKIHCYGFYDNEVRDGTVIAVPQLYSGTITATPLLNDLRLPTLLPFYQLSFPCFPGFSGSPLYVEVDAAGNMALAGMVFGNRSSKVVERVLDDFQDGKTRIIEKSVRIWESGVAHTCATLQEAAKQLGEKIWS